MAIVDAAGNPVVEYKYDAWGKSSSDIVYTGIGLLNPFRYRGYVWDEENQLFYNMSRYYNSVSCRFINADNIFDINAKVAIFNRFAYCDNSPIVYFDTEGHALFSVLTQLAIGFVVGAIVGGAIATIQGGDTKDVIEAAILGGLSGAISVIPVFKDPYLNSAIMGGVGNTVSKWLGDDLDSIYDVIDAFSDGAQAGLVGQLLGNITVGIVDDYWQQLTRAQKNRSFLILVISTKLR